MKNNFVRFVNNLKDFSLSNELNHLPVDEIFIGSKAESFLKSDKVIDAQKLSIKLNIRKLYTKLLKQIQKRFVVGKEDMNSIQLLLNEFSHVVPSNPDTILSDSQWLRSIHRLFG